MGFTIDEAVAELRDKPLAYPQVRGEFEMFGGYGRKVVLDEIARLGDLGLRAHVLATLDGNIDPHELFARLRLDEQRDLVLVVNGVWQSAYGWGQRAMTLDDSSEMLAVRIRRWLRECSRGAPKLDQGRFPIMPAASVSALALAGAITFVIVRRHKLRHRS